MTLALCLPELSIPGPARNEPLALVRRLVSSWAYPRMYAGKARHSTSLGPKKLRLNLPNQGCIDIRGPNSTGGCCGPDHLRAHRCLIEWILNEKAPSGTLPGAMLGSCKAAYHQATKSSGVGYRAQRWKHFCGGSCFFLLGSWALSANHTAFLEGHTWFK